MIIENISEFNRKLVDAFIKRIPTIKEIEDDIMNNIVIIRDNEQVLGIISYENYIDKGLIRYFIFQKDVDFETLKKLFNKMKEKCVEEKIKCLITVIEENELVEFFSKLGFEKIDLDKIYLFETTLKDTVYKDAISMIYKIEKGS